MTDESETAQPSSDVLVNAAATQLGGKPVDPANPWLDNFYKECGREVTLAYTTLNQLMNWAMAIVAASISAAVALTRLSGGEPQSFDMIHSLPLFIVAVITYVFNLRFFFRTILCYINLLRWNRLQSDILSLKLLQAPPPPGQASMDPSALRDQLSSSITNYYHAWLATIDRKTQLLHVMKLGFALFLFLPIFFVVAGAFTLWNEPVARALTLFVLGTTLVEWSDFILSPYFDTPARNARRRKRSSAFSPPFPVPATTSLYVVAWSLTLAISLLVAFWPTIYVAISEWLRSLR